MELDYALSTGVTSGGLLMLGRHSPRRRREPSRARDHCGDRRTTPSIAGTSMVPAPTMSAVGNPVPLAVPGVLGRDAARHGQAEGAADLRRIEIAYFGGTATAERCVQEHERVITALEAGDLERAGHELEENWRASLARLARRQGHG